MAEKLEQGLSQLRKGVLELAVLGLLSGGSALYGSQIVERLEHRPGLSISVGTVYPLLSRLKKAGVIDSEWVESPTGPPRKYYRLTASGQRQFESLSRAWTDVRTDVDDLLEEVAHHA